MLICIFNRACLKDLPDNIIFHLKRFEFNLRTLQRSKINDYFTFPDTINLKPYTAEALKDPDLGGEDMFELVGILVHAGTAESGHYYSYIRERPTKPNRPSWVEFNDETVTPWDPSLKESATFGGAEHRQPFDGNGCPYEKSYSAYMLFYQRTSSLKRQQAEMDETELSVPMHVSMEGDQMDHIKDENTNLLRRHCIFDPAHSSLVQSLFDRSAILDRTVDDADTASEKTVDGGGSETPSSMISLPSKSLRGLAMEMSLSYLDQVASRQQDERILHGIMGMMQTAAETSPQDAFWVYKYFYERPEAMRSLVQRNPDSSTRQDMVSMYLHALHKISEEMPRFYDRDSALVDEDDTSLVPSVDEAGVPVLSGVMVIFEHLWRFFQGNMRAWDEHFGFLRSFAQMGGRETARVLAEDYLLRLCRMVSADASIQMTPQYNRMVQNIQRRPNGKLPSYAEILRTIDHLLQSLAPELDADTIVEYPEDRLEEEHSPFSWSSAEAAYMHWHPEGQAYSFFVEKLVAVDQLPVVTDRIVMRLVQLGDRMDLSVAQALKANIRGDPPSHPVDSYLRVAMRYLSTTKVMSRAQALMTHVANEAKDLHMADMRALVVFFQEAIRLGSSDADTDVDVDPDVSDSGSGNPRRALREYTFELAPRWVPPALAHPSPDVRAISLRIVDTEILTEEPPAAGGLSETTEDVDPAAGEEDTEGTFFGGGSGHSGSQRDKVILRAQRLGVACLQHLRDNHVRPGAPISREQADPIARVIRRCRAYFDVEVNATEDLPMIFQILQEG